MQRTHIRFALLILIGLLPALAFGQQLQTEYVILITFDGMRWQEVFTGADPELIDNEDYVRETETLSERFWSDTPKERRRLLMPFFWSTLDSEGRIYGNRVYGNNVNVTNKFWFSYPGYNEILTGSADDAIDSNDKIPNENRTVLEYVNESHGFRNTVAAFASWDVFPSIINSDRSGIPVNAGFDVTKGPDLTRKEKFLNELQRQIPSPWSTVRLDAFTHGYAMEHLKEHTPRLLYISYGETDDFAHDGHYDAYLDSAHRTDQFIADLWDWAQSHEPYRNRTTFLITTDHGRGTLPLDTWKGHDTNIKGADQIWFAVIGPDTSPIGEMKSPGQYYQNQFARTIADFLALPFGVVSTAGPSISEVVGQ